MPIVGIAQTLFDELVREKSLRVQLVDHTGVPLVAASAAAAEEVFAVSEGKVIARSMQPARDFVSLPVEGRPGEPRFLIASFPAGERGRWEGLLAAMHGALSFCGEKEYENENLSHNLALAYEEVCTFEELSQRLPGYEDVEHMAEIVLSSLCRATGASQALFALCDDRGTNYRILLQVRSSLDRGISRVVPADDPSYSVAEGLIGRSIREKRSRYMESDGFASAGLTRAESQATRNLLVVPMPFTSPEGSQVLGALCLLDRERAGLSTGAEFTSAEQRLAEAIGILVGALLGTRQAAELRKEMEVAKTIQNALLPKNAPKVRGYDLAGEYRPARQVGGDYFDFVPMADGSLLAVIADVSGHTLASGMMMFMARALIRAAAARGGSPAKILRELSGNLFRDLIENDRFITLFLARVRPGRRLLEFASAGHNPPLLVRAKGKCLRLEAEGMVIGFRPDRAYSKNEIRLSKGDVLVLYTDGITEASSASGDMFGEERLLDVVSSVRELPAADILQRIFTKVAEFADGKGEGDDVTAIVVKAV